jgi:glycosyltransferase involved in cell wall biosynthesis
VRPTDHVAPSTDATRSRGVVEVTAVIPTALRRPQLLERALESVRRQQGVDVEIVVVADVAPGTAVPDLGGDVAVHRLDGPLGACAARNAGAAVAGGEWVAFLDDDDTWAPDKLQRQLVEARKHGPDVIVSSRFTMIVDGQRSVILPRLRFVPSDDFSEYVFCRRLPFASVGIAPTSTFLTSVALARRCEFSLERRSMQDLDWVLRATKRHGACLVQLSETLTDMYVDRGRAHIAGSQSWRMVARWIDANRDLLTPASAAGALLMSTGRTPDARGDYAAVVRAAFKRGKPRLLDLAASVGVWVMPRRLRGIVAEGWAAVVHRSVHRKPSSDSR